MDLERFQNFKENDHSDGSFIQKLAASSSEAVARQLAPMSSSNIEQAEQFILNEQSEHRTGRTPHFEHEH